MKQTVDVSLILPAYNEENVIRHTLEQLAAFVHANHGHLGTTELVVVAAGTDKTADIARSFEKSFDQLQVLTPNARVGKGRDVRVGMQAARGQVQLFMDADLSTPLHHILPTIATLKEGKADVAIGTRKLSRIHAGLLRSLLSVASNAIIRLLLFPRIADTQCGFKGFTAQASKLLFAKQSIQGWGFDLEVLQYAKEHHLKVVQLPIIDWHEARGEDLRGERLGSAAFRTLRDLSLVRLQAWERSVRHFWYLWIVAAMAAVFGLSTWLGSQQSVWFDEAYSIMLAKQSYSQLVHLTGVDIHPPLHYISLKAWSGLFGMSEFALRSFSAVCGALAAGISLVIVRRLWGLRAMLITTPFIVLAPYLLRYDFEIRMYALGSLVGIAATYVLIRATQAKAKARLWWWAGYAVLVAIGMYTLYYMALIWCAHALWIAYLAWRQQSWRLLGAWLAAVAGSVLLYIPWLGTFLDQMQHSNSVGITHRMNWDALISTFSFLFTFQAQWQLSHWEFAAVILGVIVSSYSIVQAFRHTTNTRPYLLLLLLCLVVPFLILTIASLPPLKPLFMMRYTAHVVIAGYLLLGVSLAIILQARVRGALLSTAIVAALFIYGLINLQHNGNLIYEQVKRPQMRQITARITPCPSDSTIIAGSPYLYFEMAYYLPNCDLLFFRDKLTSDRGGYAILYKSPRQYFSGDPLTTRNVYTVYSPKQPVNLPSAYRAKASTTVGNLRLTHYER